MSVRVDCRHCDSKMRIQTSSKMSIESKRLSCHCPKCNAVSVFMLSFSHDVHPPQYKKNMMIAEEIRNMPPEEQRALLEQAGLSLTTH